MSIHRAKVSQPLSHFMSVPTIVHRAMVRPLTCALLCCVQGQGALSERLRSFSMQDLTTIRGDGAPAPSGPPPPGTGRSSGKHSQPKMSRSASESAGSSGRSPSFPFALWDLTIKRHILDGTQSVPYPVTCRQQRHLLGCTRLMSTAPRVPFSELAWALGRLGH